MSYKLRECPFCGNSEVKFGITRDIRWFVICDSCGASIELDGYEETITAWNTRYELTCKIMKDEVEFVDEAGGFWIVPLSCGHSDICCVSEPRYCSYCGAKVVGD